MYRQGEGVTKNYKQALKWYQKGADQRNGSARRSLASLRAWRTKQVQHQDRFSKGCDSYYPGYVGKLKLKG